MKYLLVLLVPLLVTGCTTGFQFSAGTKIEGGAFSQLDMLRTPPVEKARTLDVVT